MCALPLILQIQLVCNLRMVCIIIHEYDLCFIYTNIIIILINYNNLTRIFKIPNIGNHLFLNK